jgi:hypothetical protein
MPLLCHGTKLNAKAITNLSKWTKDAIVSLNEGWSKLALQLEELYNITRNIREVSTVTKQLEFALMQLHLI